MRKFHLKGKAAEKIQSISASGKNTEENETRNMENGEQKKLTEQKIAGGFLYSWRTDVGRIRKTNQDAVILGCGLAGIADGMGGHNGGEVASNGLKEGLYREIEGKKPDQQVLNEAIDKINSELWEKQENDAALTGMGTTLTVLWPDQENVLIAQVGDSRAYLFRSGEIKRVTEDHSIVADMVRRGVLTEEQAACHPLRNYITRAVGTDDTIEADMYVVNRQKGDRWLICSDGLYGQVPPEEMLQFIRLENMEEAADRLLQSALDHGGKDNISFVLLEDLDEHKNIETNSAQSESGEAQL